MKRTHSQAKVREILRPFHERRRLVGLVSTMTREIERLTEDNLQLRAAVRIYQELSLNGGAKKGLERGPGQLRAGGRKPI